MPACAGEQTVTDLTPRLWSCNSFASLDIFDLEGIPLFSQDMEAMPTVFKTRVKRAGLIAL